MKCPYNGMDPRIERQIWPDFHSSFLGSLRELLAVQIVPKYVCGIEQRLVIDWTDPDSLETKSQVLIPDASVSLTMGRGATAVLVRPNGTASEPQAELHIPDMTEQQVRFLAIREREGHQLVCVVELLSPSIKTVGGAHQQAYLNKRGAYLGAGVHLVEIDLLREGMRPPLIGTRPEGDYNVVVYRNMRAGVYAWKWDAPMPKIPIPLKPEDPDAVADLQNVFATVFERGQYGYLLSEPAALPSGDDSSC